MPDPATEDDVATVGEAPVAHKSGAAGGASLDELLAIALDPLLHWQVRASAVVALNDTLIAARQRGQRLFEIRALGAVTAAPELLLASVLFHFPPPATAVRGAARTARRAATEN